MPIPFKPQNIIVFASTLSPIFITFYFILEGAFNGHAKFIIWLVGLFIAIMAGILLRSSGGFAGDANDMASQANDIDNYVKKCVTFDGPFNGSYDKLEGPSSHAIFHGFTILYILLSVFDNPNDVGWGFVITLIIIAAIDLAVRKKNNCNTMTFRFVTRTLNCTVGFFGGTGGGMGWGAWNCMEQVSKDKRTS